MAIVSALYLGTFTLFDTNKTSGNSDPENWSSLQGFYGTTILSGGPSLQSTSKVTLDITDTDPADGQLRSDIGDNSGFPIDTITVDTGGGLTTFNVDTIFTAVLDITYVDGTVALNHVAIFVQDSSGRVFILNHTATSVNISTDTAIQSIDVQGTAPNGLTNIGISNLTDFVCFVRGTLIETPDGPVPVEHLEVGDMVLTQDNGPQPIIWIGSREVVAVDNMAPIKFCQGALGNTRDLWVSPQHRMLISGWKAELYFGEFELLAPAKSLINDRTILSWPGGMVEYFHLMFSTHQIIFAVGCASESFYPGPQGWKTLSPASRQEFAALFPDFAYGKFDSYGPAARRLLRTYEALVLAED